MAMWAQLSNCKLNLQQIEQRMDLFPKWLKYHLDENYPNKAKSALDDLFNFGYMAIHTRLGEPPENMTFDEWLIFEGYEELAINRYDRPKIKPNLWSKNILDELLNYQP